MNEIWKDIEGYPNYQISSKGRVKSLNYNRTGEEKIMKISKNNWGYLLVNLHKEGKQKHYYIHRLVAQAFLDNPNNLLEVNHKDENKTNNRVDNLEWCTTQYNTNYGTRTEKTQKPVLQFTLDGEFIRKWDSITQVQKELGFDNGDLSKCCKGKKKSVGGFKWCYHYKSLWIKKHVPLIKQKR